MIHMIPTFSFPCLIGYFYKQDAGWKMIRLGCKEISIRQSYFTAPEPLQAGDGQTGIATERTPCFVGVNDDDLTARMLVPWFPCIPSSRPWAACQCVAGLCTVCGGSQLCPCQAGGTGLPWGRCPAGGPRPEKPSSFPHLGLGGLPWGMQHRHSPGCPEGPGEVLNVSCLVCECVCLHKHMMQTAVNLLWARDPRPPSHTSLWVLVPCHLASQPSPPHTCRPISSLPIFSTQSCLIQHSTSVNNQSCYQVMAEKESSSRRNSNLPPNMLSTKSACRSRCQSYFYIDLMEFLILSKKENQSLTWSRRYNK